METKFVLTMSICLLVCFFYSVSFGCQYTIRDIGFTDIGFSPYHLYYYIQNDTPEDLISMFKQTSYVTLMDSNVKSEIINVDQQKDHPAMTYFRFWEIKSFPAAILVSPKGKSLVLSISDPKKPFKKTLLPALESVVMSPKRKEILQHIVKAYCVVLLIQGKNKAENKNAQKKVTEAINEISKTMSQMTRTIDEPPRLIIVPSKSVSDEKVLLWSLGGNKNDMLGIQSQSKPYVAVLYGRGRRIGPLFKGKGITTNAVSNVLSVVGLACECGFDKTWALGEAIPLRWNEKIQFEVTQLLGFDAESPMVKVEISQILSLGTLNSGEGNLNEYSEEPIKFKSESTGIISPSQLQEMGSQKSDSSYAGSTLRITLFIIGGIVLLILAGGVFIILRSRRKLS